MLNKSTMLHNLDFWLKALLVLGVAAYLFNVVFLPNVAHIDARLYVSWSREIMQGGMPDIPFPLQPVLVAMFFTVIPLPLFPFVKLFNVLLFFGTLLSVYFTGKLFLKRHYLLPVVFFCSSYYVLTFFAVNYIDPLVTFFVALFTYLFLKENSTQGIELTHFIGMALIILLMALTKLSGLALAFPMALFGFCLLLKKRGFREKSIATIAIALLIFSAIGIVLLSEPKNSFERIANKPGTVLTGFSRMPSKGFEDYAAQAKNIYFALLRFPSNKCLNQLVFGSWLPLAELGFVLVTLPLVLLAFASIFILRLKKLEHLFLFSICFLGLLIVFNDLVGLHEQIVARQLIVCLPALALLFSKAFNSLDRDFVKKIVFASLAVFCVYSFAYSSFTSFYFQQPLRLYEDSFEFVSGLPAGGKCYWSGTGHVDRGLNCQGGAIVAGSEYANNITYYYDIPTTSQHRRVESLVELGELFKVKRVTHLFVGCYKERFDLGIARFLEERGKLELVYGDDCANIFEVVDYNFSSLDSRAEEIEMGLVFDASEVEGAEVEIVRAVDECH